MSHGFGNARSQGASGFSGTLGASGFSGPSGFSGATPTLGPRVILAQTAPVTITNNAAETSALTGGFTGSQTIAANTFTAGKALRYCIWGNMLNQITTATITFKVKLGSGAFLSMTSQNGGTAINSTSTTFWRMEGEVKCITTGASGAFTNQATGIFPATNATWTTVYNYSQATLVFDTTSSLVLDFTITNANSGSQSIRTDYAVFELVG